MRIDELLLGFRYTWLRNVLAGGDTGVGDCLAFDIHGVFAFLPGWLFFMF